MKTSIAALAFSACLLPAMAANPPLPTVAAKSWLLLDVANGQVIAADAPDKPIEPASLTKVMTANLVFAAIRDQRLTLGQTVTVTAHACQVDASSSKMFLKPGDRVTIDELLHGLLVQSGNDAAVALAEAVAGDEAAFVAMMNAEAARMGLHGTRFANPHGLPDPRHYSTARDLATLARHVIDAFPEFHKLFAVKRYTYNHITQVNHNRLLWLAPSVDGMKTGHTAGSGYSLIASARRPGGGGEQRLVSVVAGAPTVQALADGSQTLLNWGFRNYETVKLFDKNQTVVTATIWKGARPTVKIGVTQAVLVTLPRGAAGKLHTEVARKGRLLAPMAANANVGTLKVSLDERPLLVLPLYTLEKVESAGWGGRLWDSVRLWCQPRPSP